MKDIEYWWIVFIWFFEQYKYPMHLISPFFFIGFNNMYPEPTMDPTIFTIYSKNKCLYCKKVKKILQEQSLPFLEIECDVFLAENKDAFLKHLRDLAGVQVRTFPMVFHQGMFIGGFEDTQEYLHNIIQRYETR